MDQINGRDSNSTLLFISRGFIPLSRACALLYCQYPNLLLYHMAVGVTRVTNRTAPAAVHWILKLTCEV